MKYDLTKKKHLNEYTHGVHFHVFGRACFVVVDK